MDRQTVYLFEWNPHGEEGHHLEDVELQKPPEKHLNLCESVREASGQHQQPVHHQAPLTGHQPHWATGEKGWMNSKRERFGGRGERKRKTIVSWLTKKYKIIKSKKLNRCLYQKTHSKCILPATLKQMCPIHTRSIHCSQTAVILIHQLLCFSHNCSGCCGIILCAHTYWCLQLPQVWSKLTQCTGLASETTTRCCSTIYIHVSLKTRSF